MTAPQQVWPKPCRDCDHPIYPRSQHPPARFRHEARGLCNPCYRRHAGAGTLDDVAPLTFGRDELMAEWDVLRGEGYSKRQAAERIGISYARFDRAYCRARAAGDPRAYVPGWSTPPLQAAS